MNAGRNRKQKVAKEMEMERNENVWCAPPPPPEMSHFQMNVHHEVAVAVVLGVRIH